MLLLITGLLLFLGIHSIGLLAPSLRQAAITRMGEMPWKGLYSVVSLIGFVLICYRLRAKPPDARRGVVPACMDQPPHGAAHA